MAQSLLEVVPRTRYVSKMRLPDKPSEAICGAAVPAAQPVPVKVMLLIPAAARPKKVGRMADGRILMF
jgi:hypothetical protein